MQKQILLLGLVLFTGAGILSVKWRNIEKSTTPQRFLLSSDNGQFAQDSIDRSDPGIYPGFYMQWLDDEWGPSIYSDALLNAAFLGQTTRMDTLTNAVQDSVNVLYDTCAAIRYDLDHLDIPTFVSRTGMPVVLNTIVATTTSISGFVAGGLPLNTVGTLTSDAISSDTTVGAFWLLTGQAAGTAWGGCSYSTNPYKGYQFDSLYFSATMWLDNSVGGDVAPDAFVGMMAQAAGTRVIADPTTIADAIGFRRLGSTGQWYTTIRSNGSTVTDVAFTGPALRTYAKYQIVVSSSYVSWYIDDVLIRTYSSGGKRNGAYYYLVSGMNRNAPFTGNYRQRILAASAVLFGWQKAAGIDL